jgi:hypothetical protein
MVPDSLGWSELNFNVVTNRLPVGFRHCEVGVISATPPHVSGLDGHADSAVDSGVDTPAVNEHAAEHNPGC